MIDFSKFYDDIEFVAALFYNNLLTDENVRIIADKLTETENDDVLIDIIVSSYTDDNLKKIEKYIESKKIKIKNKKIFLTKKIFQYILKNEISISDGIRFIHLEISNNEEIKEYVGDDIGIEQILGNFYAIDDGDVTDPKSIKRLIQKIQKEMKEYIKNN